MPHNYSDLRLSSHLSLFCWERASAEALLNDVSPVDLEITSASITRSLWSSGAGVHRCRCGNLYEFAFPSPSTVSWQNSVRAPVISTMSNFISGRDSRFLAAEEAAGGWGHCQLSSRCPLTSHQQAQKCFLCLSHPTLTYLFCIKTVATSLHATSFCIVRHQRPALLATAAPFFLLKHIKAKEKKHSALLPVSSWPGPL